MARGKHSKKNAKTTATAATTSMTVAAAEPVAAPKVVLAPVVEVKRPAPTLAQSLPTTKVKVSREAIAQRAFELFRARGGQHGHAMRDWLQAEAELTLGKQ